MKLESTHPGATNKHSAFIRKSTDTLKAYGWRRGTQGTETDILADIARELGIREQEKENKPNRGITRTFRFLSPGDADIAETKLRAAGCTPGRI